MDPDTEISTASGSQDTQQHETDGHTLFGVDTLLTPYLITATTTSPSLPGQPYWGYHFDRWTLQVPSDASELSWSNLQAQCEVDKNLQTRTACARSEALDITGDSEVVCDLSSAGEEFVSNVTAEIRQRMLQLITLAHTAARMRQCDRTRCWSDQHLLQALNCTIATVANRVTNGDPRGVRFHVLSPAEYRQLFEYKTSKWYKHIEQTV
jgi:hypothetical protein